MPHYKLAFLGFGNVGKALAQLLMRKQAELNKRYGITFQVAGIATGRHGSAINLQGISLETALEQLANGKNLADLSAETPAADAFDFIRRCQADVLFENTPVNYADGEPAVSHIRAALRLGMHVATANKGPVVHAYHELRSLAKQNGVHFFHESTVMDGCPIFSLFRGSLPAARLLSFSGIFNSTTNLILARMEEGESFAEAVAYAQKIGIAETDPSGDIDGWDAAIKVSALVTVLMDVPFQPAQVDRTGIRGITPALVQAALAEGYRYKLVCSAHLTDQGISARVYPEKVPSDSPMYNISGTSSIVQFETDVLGLLTVIEDNPGPHTTAYGLLADFINAVASA